MQQSTRSGMHTSSSRVWFNLPVVMRVFFVIAIIVVSNVEHLDSEFAGAYHANVRVLAKIYFILRIHMVYIKLVR